MILSPVFYEPYCLYPVVYSFGIRPRAGRRAVRLPFRGSTLFLRRWPARGRRRDVLLLVLVASVHSRVAVILFIRFFSRCTMAVMIYMQPCVLRSYTISCGIRNVLVSSHLPCLLQPMAVSYTFQPYLPGAAVLPSFRAKHATRTIFQDQLGRHTITVSSSAKLTI